MLFPVACSEQSTYVRVKTLQKLLSGFHVFACIQHEALRLNSDLFHFAYLLFADLAQFESYQLLTHIGISRLVIARDHQFVERIPRQVTTH
jgi:hypothetical protein